MKLLKKTSLKIFKDGIKLAKKYKKILFICASFLFLIIFFYLSIYGPWWKIWPQEIRGIIALNRLAISVYEDPYCRPDCYFYRSEYKEQIISSFHKKRFLKRASRLIFDESENLNWRIEVTKLLSEYDNIEDNDILIDLQNYLIFPEGNLDLKNIISLYFSSYIDIADYTDYLKLIILNHSSNENKSQALINLSSLNYMLADFYLEAIKKSDNSVVVEESLRALASDSSRFDVCHDDLLGLLDSVIRFSGSSFSAKRVSLFMLSEFMYRGVDTAREFFEKIIFSGEIDDFSRYLAVDIFNNYSNNNYELPEISPDDWTWYHNQR
jgi:hypothetical protein